MERFTLPSYESIMKLAKIKFKNEFEVINTREIDFSTIQEYNMKLLSK